MKREGVLSWFARNLVAANLLMVGILVTGLLVLRGIRQEVYPEFLLDEVDISMDYRGASPEEIERSIVRPIESELRGMEVIREIRSYATQGSGRVTAELMPGTDRNRGLQEVTAAVQRVSIFPDDAELPRISLENSRRREVVRIVLYGDLDERGLVNFARMMEQRLLSEDGISMVDFSGVRNPEVRIEIPQEKLRSLGLTLNGVANAIEAAALDVPAGTMRTPGGDFLLRTQERRDYASEFAEIPIVSEADGSTVLLSSLAKIEDGFEDSDREAYYNGKRAVFISVYNGENQSPLEAARIVKKFVEREQKTLPDTVNIALSRDRSEDYKERIELLLWNGAIGLLLVLFALGIFLELRVAFWTAIGIPISVLGSLALLPLMDGSINMLSLFGFIVTLGIVVDDAVVVGEEIFHLSSEGMPRMEAAITGVKRMALPVIFAVTTNIITFIPLLLVPGETGQFFEVLPAVVIAVFTVSLVECLLILPAHLGSLKSHKSGWMMRFDDWQSRLRSRLDDGIDKLYHPILSWVIRWRILTCTVFVAGLVMVVAYFASGRLPFTFRPTIETDMIQAEIEMPSGTPVERTREVAFEVEEAAKRVLEAHPEKGIMKGILTTVAQRSNNEAQVSVMLVPQSQRETTGEEFAGIWRDGIGEISDMESLFFDYLFGPGGSSEIDVQLAHPETDVLRQAASDLAAVIERFPGVEDVRKGFGREMPQLDFEITPEARSMGITSEELGRQVRDSFHGAEALRQLRGWDEVRVMLRLPEKDRRSLSGLESLLIRAPDGGEIPFNQAARTVRSEAPVRIERVNGGRVVNVTANVVPGVGNSNRVLNTIEKNDLPKILAKYPGLRYTFEGDKREQSESLRNLSWGLLGALMLIFSLMAALLRSYVQAFVTLLTLPWSLAGALVGHIIMGFDLSVFSLFGMIALCGMVVNGAFVMAVTRNELREQGRSLEEAVRLAARRRFRPILLTAVTTFVGLAPMIFETSLQALFLVPMAISLGVGTLVSAAVTLLLIPAVMMIVDTIRPSA